MTSKTDAPSEPFADVGARLKAHRTGHQLTPDQLAARLGISRAALYRAEKGEIAKIDMLTSISRELSVSLPTLLGVGIEYLPSALSFFERMRQLEADCNQIIGVFSPVSFLLTSAAYDAVLSDVLHESCLDADDLTRQSLPRVLTVLRKRKAEFTTHRPLIASIISVPDLELFLQNGMVGRNDMSAKTILARRQFARNEVMHIADMLRAQPIGVQIGLASEPLPGTSFQIMRGPNGAALAISPFRLGQQPNIGIGVGLVTRAPEALRLHEEIAQRLWDGALKGVEAAERVERAISEFAVKAD